MKRSWRGRWAPAWLAALFLAGIAAPRLAPSPPDRQEDVAGARYLPPLTRAYALRLPQERTWIVTELRAVPNGYEYMRAGRRDSLPRDALAGPPAPRFYLLGTDSLGRDLASRLLYGIRHSLGVAALSVLLALLLGIAVGLAAGAGGGFWDAALMRGVDAIRCIPRVLLFLVCASLFPASDVMLILILGLTTWTGLARIVRGEMRGLMRSEMAAAARAGGASPARVALLHLLPQMGPLLAINTALRFADTILLESALSLVGLGAPPPAVSLGSIMASGRDALAEAWWIAAWPGLLIALSVLALRSAAVSSVRGSEPPSVA